MKISELIKELQSHLEEFGDLETYVPTTWGGFQPITSVSERVIIWDKEELELVQIGVVIEN